MGPSNLPTSFEAVHHRGESSTDHTGVEPLSPRGLPEVGFAIKSSDPSSEPLPDKP